MRRSDAAGSSLLLFGALVQGLFQCLHGLGVLPNAAKNAAPNLNLAAKPVKRRKLRTLGIFNVLHSQGSKLFEQGFEHCPGLLAILAEHIALVDVVGTLAACKRLLTKSHVCHQVECVELFALVHSLL